jgi:hypothetical protein
LFHEARLYEISFSTQDYQISMINMLRQKPYYLSSISHRQENNLISLFMLTTLSREAMEDEVIRLQMNHHKPQNHHQVNP